MDRTEMEKVAAYLKSAYPRERWDDDRMRVYSLELADLEFQSTQTAVREWVRSQSQPPTIADIRHGYRVVKSRVTYVQGQPPMDDIDPAKAAQNFRRLGALIRSHTVGELPRAENGEAK